MSKIKIKQLGAFPNGTQVVFVMIKKGIFMQHSLLQPVEMLPFPFPFPFLPYRKPEGKQNPTGGRN